MASVYLDYIIPRESFRYYDKNQVTKLVRDEGRKADIRIRDISDEWFDRLRKPDFQRETNSWSPSDCVELLDSIVQDLVVPGIITWKNSESGLIYVIDGAHRLSVVRAWMIDDWGDGRIEYYNEYLREDIQTAANEIRKRIKETIGTYQDVKNAHKQLRLITDEGNAPKSIMNPREYKRAKLYDNILDGSSLTTQWVQGTYNDAERSFLRINRGGQKLNDFETALIEHRNGPYARVISSIVNSGRSGHFWPEADLDTNQRSIISSFNEYASSIHNILFCPPFKDAEIVDFNQPLVLSKPGDRYQDLLDLAALVVDGALLTNTDMKIGHLALHHADSTDTVIRKADSIYKTLLDRLSQLVGNSSNPRSLSIVPLIYTYNHQGNYSRNLLYGFIYWLFHGSQNDIKTKKLALSMARGTFEDILMRYKSQITSVASKKGGSFKSTPDIANTINSILHTIIKHIKGPAERIDQDLKDTLGFTVVPSKHLNGRSVSKSQRNQVNIANIFNSKICCHICKGAIDLRQGKQYDHYLVKFAKAKSTTVDNIKPTHPFCNNQRDQIEALIKSPEMMKLPSFSINRKPTTETIQLSLFNM